MAVSQHGVISRSQLRDLGLGKGAIEHRIRRRLLHRVHPRVYAVGHPVLTQAGIWMAAVLAGGERAVLSHWSAASLWGIRPGGGPRSHVTVPRRRRSTERIVFHYAELDGDEVGEEEGIPVTTPGRVLLDLAPSMFISSLTHAVELIERKRLHTGPSIPELVERYPRRAGTPKLRAVCATPMAMTRSELEARFLAAVLDWEIPRPQMNLNVLGYEADCVWPKQRVIVELDAFETHGSTFAFERDRERDRRLQAAGWVVIRVTAAQLASQPDAVRRDLTRLLNR